MLSLFIAMLFAQINYGQTVTIGTQVWATKNLDVSFFRNGDPIPEAKTDEEWLAAGRKEQPAWCYYNNDPANGEKYGKLYNWYAVNDPRGLAPSGYHIPTDEDWTRLTDFLGGESKAGMKMKSTEFWAEIEGKYATNESGFSGLPGGCRMSDGSFSGIGKLTYYWSSTVNVSFASYLHLSLISAFMVNSYRADGVSVRCLRD